MDVFVLPSWAEGMSNALMEAMAAARPVVATDVGGNAEVVADGRTGVLVPPGDPAAIAERRRAACSDEPDRAARLGSRRRGRSSPIASARAPAWPSWSAYTRSGSRSATRRAA